MASKDGLYSFVTEICDCLILEQFRGTSSTAAIANWYRQSVVKPNLHLDIWSFDYLLGLTSAVTKRPGVWSFSGDDRKGASFGTHVIGPLSDERSTSKSLFTFVTEKEGGTYIEQFSGLDTREAVSQWFKKSITSPTLREGESGADLVPIAGAKGASYYRAVDPKGTAIVGHVIGPLAERLRLSRVRRSGANSRRRHLSAEG